MTDKSWFTRDLHCGLTVCDGCASVIDEFVAELRADRDLWHSRAGRRVDFEAWERLLRRAGEAEARAEIAEAKVQHVESLIRSLHDDGYGAVGDMIGAALASAAMMLVRRGNQRAASLEEKVRERDEMLAALNVRVGSFR